MIAKKTDFKPPPVEEKHGYEFAGPLGASAITFGLPILVYAMTFLCNDVSGCPAPALLHPHTLTLEKLKAQTPWPKDGIVGLFDLEVFLWTLAYYGFSLFLQVALPGNEVQGTELSIGGRLDYKFNSFSSMILSFALLGAGTAVYGADWIVWTYVWDNMVQFVTAHMIVAASQAVYVYLASFSVPHPGQPNPQKRELAKGGHSGNIIYDFYIGRELNPRFTFPRWIPIAGGQTIDLKIFNEMRPGFNNYIMLNLTYMAYQYRTYGKVTDSLIVVTVFQAWYLIESVFLEEAILTTMDITTDGFGYMLSFGDLIWVPFFYSIQGRYLAVHPIELGLWGITAVLAVQAVGYYIFRTANNEKNRLRSNPDDPRVAGFDYIQTAAGTKLLVSGWWGWSRHPNYFGDWIMGFSYCIPTGVAGYVVNNYTNPVTGAVTKEVQQGEARGWGMIFTYFYILYFGVLLVHRASRDDAKCRRKYGSDWDEYCRRVPWKIIPYIY